MSKSTNKNTNVKSAAVMSPKVTTSVNFTPRLAKSGGRFVGVMTINAKNQVNKYNGRVVSQSENFVTIFDNNQKRAVKIGKSTIISLSGV